MRWYGEECEFYVMISDLLGPSLEDLFNFCDRKFSLKTVLLLADQLIPRIACLHAGSFVHRDIKPENFLLGTGKLGNVVHIIDFGLAVEYQDPETHVHMAYHDKHKLVGTLRYASVNNHLGIGRCEAICRRYVTNYALVQSRRDDLESLGYILIYFCRGSLPWQGLKAQTEDEKYELVKEKKINTPIEDLCRGLPKAFASYFKHVRTLGFDDRPDYSYLRKLFRNLFVRKGLEYDHVFDWTIKKFLMMYDSFDHPVATQTSKRGNKVRCDVGDKRLASRSRSLLPLSSDVDTEEQRPLPVQITSRSNQIQLPVPSVATGQNRTAPTDPPKSTIRSKSKRKVAKARTTRSSAKPQGISKRQPAKTARAEARRMKN